jgi:hypothetical protein
MRSRLRIPSRGAIAACGLAAIASACDGGSTTPPAADTAPSADVAPADDTSPSEDVAAPPADTSPAEDASPEDDTSAVGDTSAATDTSAAGDTSPPADVVVPERPILARGDRCDALEELPVSGLPLTDAVADTAEFGDRYIYSLGPVCGGNVGGGQWGEASPDVVYAFTPHLDGTYSVKATPSGAFDLGLMVTAGCPPRNESDLEAAACLGAVDDGRAGVAEQLAVDLEAGVTVHILVDGFDNVAAHTGAFTLSVSLGETCGDGVDNDGNDAVDCADVQCATTPACDESNVATYGAGACDDGEDNDADGLTDCQDDNCARAAPCVETICDDALDDNQNGLTDCEDPGCDTSPICRAEGEGCGRAETLVPGEVRTFDTCASSNTAVPASSAPGCSSWMRDNTSSDRWFTFVATQSSKHRLTLTEDSWDAVINVVEGDCPSGPVSACVAGRDGPAGSAVTFDAVEGRAYRVIVDGWSDEADCGEADLVLSVLDPEVCDDGVDNDQNGRVDCSDSVCFGVGSCPLAPTGDDCRVPLAITTGAFSQTFDTCSYTNTFEAASAGTCQRMGAGGDIVASFTAPADGRFRIGFDTGPAGSGGAGSFDATLTVVKSSACPTTPPTVCLAGSDLDPEKVVITAVAGETFQIFADAYTAGCGNATLSVTQLGAEVCNDNLDNDENNQKDCADAACASSPLCNERFAPNGCSDGVSTDNDQLVDCSDPDCIADAAACPNGLLGDSCLAPTAMAEGSAPLTLDLCNYTDRYVTLADFSAGCKVGSTDTGTKDAVVAFTPTTTGTFAARASAGTGNVLLHQTTLAACTPGPSARHLISSCVASKNDVSFGTGVERIDFAGVAGEPVYFILESASTTCGSVSFEVIPVAPEACTGGVDDDLDGAVDCYDSGCFGVDGCPAGMPNDTCDSAETITGDAWRASFNTCSFTSGFSGSPQFGSGCRTHGAAGDALVKVVAPAAGTYSVTFDGRASGFDSVVNVLKSPDCPTAFNAACVASSDIGAVEKVRFSAEAGESFWVMVDGYSTGCGAGTLTVTRLAPENCGDGIDNDDDGFTDCADLVECNGVGACPQRELACGSDVTIAALPYADSARDLCAFDSAQLFDGATCNDNIDASLGGMVYSYTAPVAQSVRVTVTPLDEQATDLVVNLTNYCDSEGATTCLDDSDTFGAEEVNADLAAGETLYIHVNLYDSFSSNSCGAVDVNVEVVDP